MSLTRQTIGHANVEGGTTMRLRRYAKNYYAHLKNTRVGELTFPSEEHIGWYDDIIIL